ncbi:uncharacterized protein BJ171DRAFT_421660 [Polychytrium aggregatum]|uniref:uncharacterized protein n=1 Tax=Polychytrium aggregatum TaxID=110093 RepID=UPI0022FE78BF|nr:uncharacterized protein BJ171DRAFT_421660 [Polychytrium aggregatum]KAI9206582.1 hypothetical protein BJ171DRAFT_421660 [Polychytrium aggregatum]
MRLGSSNNPLLPPAKAGPSSSSYAPTTLTSFEVFTNSAIQIWISDPQKHGEGTTAFVTYLITTKTILESFSVPEFSVRRRFTDFVWLNKYLGDECPACIIPPLPDKHRMEYITGDRFSTEFIEKRRLSLQIYLDRVSRHPTLQRSQTLKQFLESSDLVGLGDAKKDAYVFEGLSDVLINVFTKVKKPDERALLYRAGVDKLEENLTAVEKMAAKLVKQESELELDYAELAGLMTTLGNMETQITVPLSEFGHTIRDASLLLKDKIQNEENDYLSNLRDYIAYCHSVREVLKLNDQKQMDFEALTGYLESYTAERERLLYPGRNANSLSTFFKDKYQELKGVDLEKAKVARIGRLELKIAELQDAVDSSHQTAEAFTNEISKEMDLFEANKSMDFKEILRRSTDAQLEYHQRGQKLWDDLIPILEGIRLVE